jgi:hypothetical protein
MRRVWFGLAALVAAVLIVAAVALAATTAAISPSFTHNALGAGTSVRFGVVNTDSAGGVPLPSSQAVIHLPPGLGVHTQGFATCSPAILASGGGSACPKGSHAGTGSALINAVLGGTVINEPASVDAYLGPMQNGHVTLNFYGVGTTPVSAQIVLPGVLEPDHAPFGQKLVVTIPPIPTVPGASPAAIKSFTVVVGATRVGLITKIIHKRVHGRLTTVKKRVKGTISAITAPAKCPAGGFPWGGDFTYSDGSVSSVTAKSRCP